MWYIFNIIFTQKARDEFTCFFVGKKGVLCHNISQRKFDIFIIWNIFTILIMTVSLSL